MTRTLPFLLLAAALGPAPGLAQDATTTPDAAHASAAVQAAPAPVADRHQWVETVRPHSLTIARQSTVADAGLIAQVAASRSSDNSCTGGCMGTIGYESIVLNDNLRKDQLQSAYAGYFEATRSIGAGTTHGIEIDVANLGQTVTLSPAHMFGFGATPGLWLASGAGNAAATDASAAVGIIANGARWQKGIVFGRDALTPRTDGNFEAIALDPRQAISFYAQDGRVTGNVYATAASGGPPVDLAFGGGGVTIASGGKPLASVDRQGVVTASVGLQLAPVAFADLPACTPAAAGTLVFVKDASAAVTRWHQRITAGGGKTQAFASCNGAGWYAFSY